MGARENQKQTAINGLKEMINQDTIIHTLVMKRLESGSKWVKVLIANNGRIYDMTWNVAYASGFRLKADTYHAILVDYEEDACRAINKLIFDQSKPLPPHVKL